MLVGKGSVTYLHKSLGSDVNISLEQIFEPSLCSLYPFLGWDYIPLQHTQDVVEQLQSDRGVGNIRSKILILISNFHYRDNGHAHGHYNSITG